MSGSQSQKLKVVLHSAEALAEQLHKANHTLFVGKNGLPVDLGMCSQKGSKSLLVIFTADHIIADYALLLGFASHKKNRRNYACPVLACGAVEQHSALGFRHGLHDLWHILGGCNGHVRPRNSFKAFRRCASLCYGKMLIVKAIRFSSSVGSLLSLGFRAHIYDSGHSAAEQLFFILRGESSECIAAPEHAISCETAVNCLYSAKLSCIV